MGPRWTNGCNRQEIARIEAINGVTVVLESEMAAGGRSMPPSGPVRSQFIKERTQNTPSISKEQETINNEHQRAGVDAEEETDAHCRHESHHNSSKHA